MYTPKNKIFVKMFLLLEQAYEFYIGTKFLRKTDTFYLQKFLTNSSRLQARIDNVMSFNPVRLKAFSQ